MNLHRPSTRQLVIILLASNLVASGLLLGVLLVFDPGLLAMLAPMASA